MNYEARLGERGKAIDQRHRALRIKGVRGTEQERERYWQEQIKNARWQMRLMVETRLFLADETATHASILESCKDSFIEQASEEADEAGLDADEKEFYVGITRSAYETLLEQYRAQGGQEEHSRMPRPLTPNRPPSA